MEPTPAQPVSVVLLASNEALTIEQEVRSFHASIIRRLPGSELIVAEDGSTDGTPGILCALKEELGIVHLSCPDRKGYARALREAALAASNDLIFFSDTGLKHDPEDFWTLYRQAGNYDLVVGRKTGRKDQLYRRLLTWGYNLFLRTTFSLREVRDADSGFRLFNRKVVDQVFRPGLRFKSLVGSEVVLRTLAAGLRYGEVPVSYAQRVGISKGMPVNSIARQIRTVLRDLRALRAELAQGRGTGLG